MFERGPDPLAVAESLVDVVQAHQSEAALTMEMRGGTGRSSTEITPGGFHLNRTGFGMLIRA